MCWWYWNSQNNLQSVENDSLISEISEKIITFFEEVTCEILIDEQNTNESCWLKYNQGQKCWHI